MTSTHYRMFRILTVLATLAIAGCTRERGEASAPEQEESAAAATNRIDIPATVRKNLGITFVKVERRRVESTIRVPGAFELQPLARHEYRLSLPGTVQLAVDQYQRIEPGDLLYRFRSPQWPELQREIIVGEQDIQSAMADIEVARARIDEADRRLVIMRERLSSLTSAEIRNADLEGQAAEMEASLPRLRAELRQAETRLANGERTREHALHRASVASGIAEEVLSAEVPHQGRTAHAYRTIDWIEVRATEPGVVETLALTDGSFAEAPSLVLSTVDPTKVRFRAMALQSDLARLGESPEGRIVPPSIPGIPLSDGVGASVLIGLEAHPEQRTVTLLATPMENRGWMRPGISAFLEVVTESSGGFALAIPRAAIVKDGITHVFFRRDPQDPNKAIRVEADMGVDDGRWVAINSGLSLNDEVVLDGVYELKLASEQGGATQRGGHFHADGTFHNKNE
ncbi:MAG: efflux RND transporter periplasmic adaptor subunit [Phycisphaerales bacterium]|nr:efflux RND transporter periplasmic adaptor subunit [Phycisphaerales bacterium]